MRLVWGRVLEVGPVRGGAQPVVVSIAGSGGQPALNYPQLTGPCGVDDEVLLNTTAVDLGLGTGGVHFVVASRSADSDDTAATDVALDHPSGGHIMKLRYTPLQVDVDAVEEPDGPHYQAMRAATSLEGMPVVCCGLHSQMPVVAAAIKAARPDVRRRLLPHRLRLAALRAFGGCPVLSRCRASSTPRSRAGSRSVRTSRP